jgi:3-dehydrotetronate 4-kinase
MRLKLGCIADDFTGGTDLANNLVRAGMRTVQVIGVPTGPLPEADAVVVALKSRTAPVAQAVSEALAAAAWLSQEGAPQIYFKVCSTFDSTEHGNIGPVADALRLQLGARKVVVTPAFPENGRTVFKGHLFVGDALLSDSPMRHHPLTPMTDSNLVRLLQAQIPHERVGLLDRATTACGAGAVLERLAALDVEGVNFCIADAIDDNDLGVLAEATRDAALVVAGSGLAIGIPRQHGLAPSAHATRLPEATGSRAIISGSCSATTNAQVEAFLLGGGAAFVVNPMEIADGVDVAAQAIAWATPRLGEKPVLVYATAQPAAVTAIQAQVGVERAGAMVEETLARVARGLVDLGVGQLLIAGGETSGACVQALQVRTLQVGPSVAPGVPWCHVPAAGEFPGLHLLLKSGNFGATDIFSAGFEVLK